MRFIFITVLLFIICSISDAQSKIEVQVNDAVLNRYVFRDSTICSQLEYLLLWPVISEVPSRYKNYYADYDFSRCRLDISTSGKDTLLDFVFDPHFSVGRSPIGFVKIRKTCIFLMNDSLSFFKATDEMGYFSDTLRVYKGIIPWYILPDDCPIIEILYKDGSFKIVKWLFLEPWELRLSPWDILNTNSHKRSLISRAKMMSNKSILVSNDKSFSPLGNTPVKP